MHSDDIHRALRRPVTAEELVAEIESAEPFEVTLYNSQRRRIRAYMERLNREPFFEDDQIDPDDEDDMATTIGGLIETALSTVEAEAGLVSDALGNLRPVDDQ